MTPVSQPEANAPAEPHHRGGWGIGLSGKLLMLTILFLIAIPAVRKLLWSIGLTGDVASLFPIAGFI